VGYSLDWQSRNTSAGCGVKPWTANVTWNPSSVREFLSRHLERKISTDDAKCYWLVKAHSHKLFSQQKRKVLGLGTLGRWHISIPLSLLKRRRLLGIISKYYYPFPVPAPRICIDACDSIGGTAGMQWIPNGLLLSTIEGITWCSLDSITMEGPWAGFWGVWERFCRKGR